MAGFTESNDGDVTGNHGNFDFWIVKLNSTGVLQWQKALGGSSSEEAISICQTTDGGYALAGITRSNNGDVTGNNGSDDFWIVKLNDTAAIQWQKTLGGSKSEQALSIIQTTNSNYIVAGWTQSSDGDITGSRGGGDAWVVQLSNTGSMQWEKTLGGTGDDRASCIIQTSDGGYIIAAISNSKDGDVTGNHGSEDFWIVKLAGSTGIEEIENKNLVYPNPTTNLLYIESSAFTPYEITNLVGQSLQKGSLENNSLSTANLSSGVYLLHLADNKSGSAIVKFVKE